MCIIILIDDGYYIATNIIVHVALGLSGTCVELSLSAAAIMPCTVHTTVSEMKLHRRRAVITSTLNEVQR